MNIHASRAAYKKRVQMAAELGILDLNFTESCEYILREMAILSREEWFEIAFLGGQGGAGFGPMRQLQMKIRHNPQTFGPEITGIFRSPAGTIFERLVQWPMKFAKVALEWKVQDPGGWRVKYDWYPWRSIDPLMDEWDRAEEAFGPDHPNTKKVIQKFLRRVLKGYEDDHDKPTAPRRPPRTKPVRRWPNLRPRNLHGDHRDGEGQPDPSDPHLLGEGGEGE